MTAVQIVMSIVFIGMCATACMDLWLVLLKNVGVPTQSFAMIGRWVGHMPRGRFRHAAIAKAAPICGELAMGWVVHYAIGIVFASVFIAIVGSAWLQQPTVMPAWLFGLASVVMPFFVMQPAMGSGIAASKTPTPFKNAARSIANHSVFGFGLFVGAWIIAGVAHV